MNNYQIKMGNLNKHSHIRLREAKTLKNLMKQVPFHYRGLKFGRKLIRLSLSKEIRRPKMHFLKGVLVIPRE